MGIGREGCWLLRLFGAHVYQAFDEWPYQVGSSLTEKRGWRDVDVRLILSDADYKGYFGDPYTPGHDGARLLMWDLAWSALGQKMTKLPIDFQFQQQTLANDEFPGVRSALFITTDDLALVRTGKS